MPRTRKPKSDEEAEPAPSFEEAFGRLESIVANMENGELPLNDLIDQYEQGTRLFSICDKLLGKARDRLEIITLKAREDDKTGDDDDVEPTSRSRPSAAGSAADPAGDDPDDDIRLF